MPFAHRRDAQIWRDRDGTGDPVLLTMGHAYQADMWHRTAPELATSYRVIRFDTRGVGHSSDPPGPYSVQLMAEDALAVLDAGRTRCSGGVRRGQLADAQAASQEILRFLAGIPGPADGSPRRGGSGSTSTLRRAGCRARTGALVRAGATLANGRLTERTGGETPAGSRLNDLNSHVLALAPTWMTAEEAPASGFTSDLEMK